MKGWYKEPIRHSLASRGVSTEKSAPTISRSVNPPDDFEMVMDGDILKDIDLNSEDLLIRSDMWQNTDKEGEELGWTTELNLYRRESEGLEYIGDFHMDLLEEGERLHIFSLYIELKYRRKGVGSLFYDILEEYIDKSGCSRVSGLLGNGGTKQFLIDKGMNEEYIHEDGPNDVVIGDKDDLDTLREVVLPTFFKMETGGVEVEKLFEK